MLPDPSCDTRTALHLQATVLPGKKIEITADELREGDRVDVFLVVSKRDKGTSPSLVEFLDSLPPGPRSFATWEEVERAFKQERDSWES
jgi:hypothetical protein